MFGAVMMLVMRSIIFAVCVVFGLLIYWVAFQYAADHSSYPELVRGLAAVPPIVAGLWYWHKVVFGRSDNHE